MNIGVIYDFGVNKGGGDFVMLNIIEVLSREGHKVTLETSNIKSFYGAQEIFQEAIGQIATNRVRTKFLPHPYSIAYMAKKVVRKKYDLLILFT